MKGHNSDRQKADEIRRLAGLIGKNVPEVREHWMNVGQRYLEINLNHMVEGKDGVPREPQGKALGKIRAELGITPEDLGLSSKDVSCALKLARFREAAEVFFSHEKSNAVDPARVLADWKRWGRDLRKSHYPPGMNDAQKAEAFPGMSRHQIDEMFKIKVDIPDDEVAKIQKLAAQADDREGTPEGDTFLTKATGLAESYGLSLGEVRKMEIDDRPQNAKDDDIRQAADRTMALVSSDDGRTFYSVCMAFAMLAEQRKLGLEELMDELVAKYPYDPDRDSVGDE